MRRLAPATACLLALLLAATPGRAAGKDAARGATRPTRESKDAFNRKGNFLIADRLNNRVIEIDPAGAIVWQFGQGAADLGGKSPLGPRSVERVGELTLIAAAGIGPGELAACASGCRDDRVLLIDRKGKIVWQYGAFATPGAEPDRLDRPTDATALANGNILIADSGNHRVIEVSRADKTIVWQHGQTYTPGTGPGQLNRPSTVVALPGGDVLIADAGNNRAVQVDRQHRQVAAWSHKGSAVNVVAADLAPDTGNVLMAEWGRQRVMEMNASDESIWVTWLNLQEGSVPDPRPACVHRVRNGDLLICDQMNHEVVVVDPNFSHQARFGSRGRAGYGLKNASEGLNAPSDACQLGN